MLKQRRESIKQYRDANRVDLAEIEEAEILVIQDFLPKALTEDEITEIVQAAISESSASSIKDMGKVMGIVRSKMIGRADMASSTSTCLVADRMSRITPRRSF
jgi:uncharacterized protein YqeY